MKIEKSVYNEDFKLKRHNIWLYNLTLGIVYNVQIKTHISVPLIGFYHIIYQNLKYLQTLVNSSDFQLEHSEKHPNFLQGFVCFKYKLKDDKC